MLRLSYKTDQFYFLLIIFSGGCGGRGRRQGDGTGLQGRELADEYDPEASGGQGGASGQFPGPVGGQVRQARQEGRQEEVMLPRSFLVFFDFETSEKMSVFL